MRPILLACLLAPALAAPALAEPCPSLIAEAAVTEGDEQLRFGFLQRALERDEQRAQLWGRAWGFGLLGATGAQVGAAPLFDAAERRAALYLGGVKSALGALSVFWLNRVKVTTASASSRDQSITCDDVHRAERAAIFTARSERVRWWNRAGSVAVNAAVAAYLGREYGAWVEAIAGAAVGIAVGEVINYTRPSDVRRAVRDYRRGAFAAGQRPTGAASWELIPVWAPGGAGAGLFVVF
jgi:hypothetical protein